MMTDYNKSMTDYNKHTDESISTVNSGKVNLEKKVIEADAIIVNVLPDGICKVQLENGSIVVAYLKGIFKNKKIKVYPQDKVCVEFSIYDEGMRRGRIVRKYRTDTRPPDAKRSVSSRKIRNRRH